MLAKRVTTVFFALAVLVMFMPRIAVAEGHELTEEREKITLCNLLLSVSETAYNVVCGKKKISPIK
jgi:hypothetical protein